ncbi:hypothetical protein K3728_05450 [Rhodobacteraceae bacterium M385]|nr:hypothetical protein K3728_05450 [Rhodobacteraceae bacterium M385]
MFRSFHPAPLTALCLLALAACQPSYDATAVGQERLEECVASACTTLNLDGAGLRDYSDLAATPQVTSLMVSYSAFSDLSDIAFMTQLRELHMGSSPVTDLSGLSAFPNLELLHAQYLGTDNLAPIAQLDNLRELAVGTSTLQDLSFVAEMPGLQRLLVITSALDLDLATLGAHRGLQTVELRSSDGIELAPLLALPNLREVSLSRNSAEIGPAQAQVVAQLRARGVRVELDQIIVPVC